MIQRNALHGALSKRLLMLGLCFAAGLLVMACSGSDESPDETATPAVTEQALLALGEQIYPFFPDSGVYGICGSSGNLTNCPVTERLANHLTAEKITLCRCQNASQTRTMTAEVTPSGGIIHVSLYQGSENVDLIVVRTGERLLVDDQVCQGEGQASSIFNTAAPCRD